MNLKHKAAVIATAATLGLAGTATAASAYSITSSAGGAAVPVGTSFSSAGGALSFQNAATGANVASCTASTLNGVTGGSGTSSQLDVTGGSYTGCKVGSQNVFVTVNASAASPWSVVPTSGTTSPFAGEVQNVNVTVRCGTATATPATYTGTLTTGVSETNQTDGSKISLAAAGSLTKSGSGCPFLPATAAVTQENVLTSVGGAPVSAANNLWLNP
ncbi:hypothetical protein [Patulibacter sp.]|uniref:hypothetical protein n=1 Tax=Patulibacter sp. TaxID=1912859 RepID=UPI002721DDBF|nr:hypothetical protein [Patulibacter sp.]MDO9407398.1 hypothetical protein [Patulibacter sp.]